MAKLYKLLSIAGISFLISSNLNYLFNLINANSLKFLIYGGVIVIGIMGVVLGEEIALYFNLKDNSVVAVLGVIITSIFLGGSYRAFSLNNQIEGILLICIIAVLWTVLLALYIKTLTANE